MDLTKEMDQLETSMEALRARYRSHFAGSQAEPLQYRWQLEASIRRLQKDPITNAMQANRFRSILQKYANYRALWNRLRREKLKLKGKTAGMELEAEPIEPGATGLDDPGGSGEIGPPPAFSGTAAAPAAPREEFRDLFDAWVEARVGTGESSPGFTFEGFAKHMRAQQEFLKTRYPGKEYVFRVVVQDGKAALTAELEKPQER